MAIKMGGTVLMEPRGLGRVTVSAGRKTRKKYITLRELHAVRRLLAR